MKLVKMSLLAATLIASSAFAIDNVKVSGDAKLYYATDDQENLSASGEDKGALFAQGSSSGQAALGLGITADLTEGISTGAHLTALTSLGLYNNLVGNVWEGTPEDAFWFDEAWIAGTWGKTTAKAGRMTLDTPMVFTETWSIAKNTFSAAVLLNQDIPDTTLVGAYVGQANDAKTGAQIGPVPFPGTGYAGVTDGFANVNNTNFHSFYEGAYAAGAINNSWKPLTAQLWYFDAQSVLSSYWLQADYASDFGLNIGGQFTGTTDKNAAAGLDSSNTAFAAMAGYEVKDIVTVSAAFSQTGKSNNGFFNAVGTGRNLSGTTQSKLYTEAWWNYGYITMTETTAFNVTATTPEELTWAALGLYVTSSTSKDGYLTQNTAEVVDLTMTEVTLEASKSFGPLDTSLLFIMTDANNQNEKAGENEGSAFNTVQAYLTYNF